MGILQQYGLPTVSRNEYIKAVQKQKEQEVLAGPSDRGGPPTGADQNYRRLGMAIGKLFTKGKDVEIPEPVEQGFEVVESAQRRFNQLRTDSPELWGGMTAEDKALTYRRFLADSAAEVGNADLATSLNDEYTDAFNARMKEKEELRKLGIETDDSLEQLNQRTYENNLKRDIGVPVAGFPLNSDDPNTARAGTQLPDNSFRYEDASGRVRIVPPGQWSSTRPQRPPAGRSGSGGNSGRWTTTNEGRIMRDDIVNTTTQLRVGMEMFNLMSTMAQEYGSIEFLSSAGDITTFLNRFIGNVASLTRTGREMAIPFTNSEGDKVGNINPQDNRSLTRFINHPSNRTWMEELDADFNESTHLGETFRSAEEWKANVVRLAYARARAREPGARQLSDNDIQQARAELGAMTTDPESFRRIMLGGLGGDLEKLEQRLNLIPDADREGMFGQKGLDDYYNLRQQFLDAYDTQGFGTAPAPGPGLTAPGANIDPGVRAPAPSAQPGAIPQQGSFYGPAGTAGAPAGQVPMYVNGKLVGYAPE